MIFNFLVISLVIQILFFIPAFFKKTDKFTDFTYSLTFVLLSFLAFLNNIHSMAKIILLLMIILWGLRLGIYLFIRINKIKKDERFNEIRINFIKFLSFWLLQGLTVFIVLIPSLLYFSKEAKFSLIGFLVWALGLIIETLADFQKYNFKNNPQNKGLWVNVGLWKYSRHPNYLGEILVWTGIYGYCFPSLSVEQKIFGILSPIFISFLIIFVSGIPKLEKAAQIKWGNNKDYQSYKKNTPILVPFLK